MITASTIGNRRPSPYHLAWRCDCCGHYLEDGEGWITVDLAAVLAVQRQWSAWEAKRHEPGAVPLGELLALPTEVPWHVYHQDCDPAPEDPAYWWTIERARTISDVFGWWLHLSGKNWFKHTDWEGLIRERVMPQAAEVAA